MKNSHAQSGFSLIELLVASTIFTFIVAGVSGLFIQTLGIQRQANGVQQIEANVLFIMEDINREVRVSKVTSPNTVSCVPAVTPVSLTMIHPINGTITYTYDPVAGTISRAVSPGAPQLLRLGGVKFTSFAFCISGSGADGNQVRVTMPMTVQSVAGKQASVTSISLQTTIVSRDLSIDPIP